MRPPDVFDDYDVTPDAEDGIQCRRCGETGLYWQQIFTNLGVETHALFDARTKRKHVCARDKNVGDAFGVVPE